MDTSTFFFQFIPELLITNLAYALGKDYHVIPQLN